MKNIFLTLTTLISFTCLAQNETYYISSQNGNLLLATASNSVTQFQHAYHFKDSVFKAPLNGILLPQIDFKLVHEQHIPKVDTVITIIKPYKIWGGHNYTHLDSIQFNSHWYKMYSHSDDDGFIGGMPNRVNQSIYVDSLGTVYSSTNYTDIDEKLLLCHSDSVKQQLLVKVYEYLSETNLWFKWSKMTDLTQRYKFKTCVYEMKNDWLKSRRDIVISSVESTKKDNTIQYNVTIKNISKTNYKLPSYYDISPAKAIIKAYDTLYTWDLIDTHSGRHFSRNTPDVYLKPGDEFSFSQVLTTNTGSSTIAEYKGFQIYSQLSFFNWLFTDKVEYEGETYEVFKFRELFDATP